ncbi:hypothetical protein LAZ67_12000987 [Cordylochernes scorpioides]|uniref:Transposase n=1 Tax=Cordylochernes scorpioides TaxID=51811 RepID=A0ABY6L0Y1_9ARAC|nr:hypothetical protein LAZ67_12000987 [Cordylochernes scorpioides]
MLEEFMQPKLVERNFYLIQDDAPAHYSNIVKTFLNEKFPHKWMRRRGPIDWPARSPDLTPADFFLSLVIRINGERSTKQVHPEVFDRLNDS